MYNVVFVYTEKAGGYKDVRFYMQYKTKEDFDLSFNVEWTKEDREKVSILEEGISVERCIKLVEETPEKCRFTANFQEISNLLG